ncbi:MAG: phosphodiesterase [Polyangiaceae bacterium]|nr:phosphodiesterase [Polyangiaceae bacterium]
MLIAQISDIHIREDGQRCCGWVDTAPFLAKAVDKLNALRPSPSAVVVTGDLVDSGSPAEYARLHALLAPLAMPYYLVVGNHDRREPLRAAFPDHAHLRSGPFVQYTIDELPVRLVVLDTNIPGQHAGELCGERLDWLERRLAEQPNRPTAIFMHHPPFKTGNIPLDRLDLSGKERLAAIVSKFRNIHGVFCGHLHRAIQARFAGTIAMTCPSTAHQVHLSLGESSIMAFDMEPPACQLHWWDGHSLVTHTAFIERFDGPFSVQTGERIEIRTDSIHGRAP